MKQTNTTGADSGSARSVMERVRSTATEQLSNQKNRATDSLGSVAHAVRQTTQPLRDNQQDVIAQYVEKAADQLERFSDQLRAKDVGELVSDAQRFARERPAIFIGAAFAAGVVAARFLKSSNHGARAEWMADSARAAGGEELRAGSGTGIATAPYGTGGL